jgi:segregation and condensation protein B
MTLDSYIEAILFYRGEPVRIKKLAELLSKTEEEISDALSVLEEKLKNRGVKLVRFEDEVTLSTASEASGIIETITREELSRDLGRAGLETLSIILYRGPITRRDIDFIRGVNSSFILRNLQIRGLAERVINPADQRSFLYKPTIDLLEHLGLQKIEDLPEFTQVRAEMEARVKALQEESNESGDIKNEPENAA